MYNTDAMGVRIGELRRAKGMTQEAFAKTLGLSPQAVSKWETGLGYPDITLLPAIAETLGVKIETLFGADPDPVAEIMTATPVEEPLAAEIEEFPEVSGEERLVHQWQDVACYANTEPKLRHGARVEFADGSSADLSEGTIVNNGRLCIRLEYAKPKMVEPMFSGDMHFIDTYNDVHSLGVKTSGDVTTRIHATDNGICRVEAQGSRQFMDSLTISNTSGRLKIENRQSGNNGRLFNFERHEENRIEIWTGFYEGEEVELAIAGSGEMNCEPSFQTAKLSISGSGDVHFSSADTIEVSIAGSGDIDFQTAKSADIRIAGSGDITGQLVEDALKVSIAGSGDVNIRESRLRNLEASIAGSGDVSIGEIAAAAATVTIRGSGDLTIPRGEIDYLKVDLSGSGEMIARGVTANAADIALGGTSEMTIGCIRGKWSSRMSKTATLTVLSNE
ncbi:MAG: DUF2807 domain-containing protein [Clostridiaceae bacterium]|nr:DUF2807 domain-containing protein [Clostridiaceae bacterium]